jgi:hypothetical protein
VISDQGVVLELVRFANGLRGLPPDALERKREEAERELGANWTGESALRVALLLSLPGTAFRDEERAAALLHEVQEGGLATEPDQGEFARFLLTMLTDQRTRASTAVAAAVRRDATRARELEGLRRELASERGRRGELEQQVEALKQLEQNLKQRTNGID